MPTLNHMAAYLNNAGLYVQRGNGVVHVGLDSGKTYAISMDVAKHGLHQKTAMPEGIKKAIEAWNNGD